MVKTEFDKQYLAKLLDDFLKIGDEEGLTEYLVSKSNLPGPRGNLELAKAFAELIEANFSKNPEKLWDLCIKAIEISSNGTPVNDPKEFLTFCGAFFFPLAAHMLRSETDGQRSLHSTGCLSHHHPPLEEPRWVTSSSWSSERSQSPLLSPDQYRQAREAREVRLALSCGLRLAGRRVSYRQD